MYQEQKILIGKSGEENVYILPRMANRHGLIAGATGTGKTVTLKVLAESFSDCGVPVFLADAKGDLAGTFQAGENSGSIQKQLEEMKLESFDFHGYPVTFWDVFGKKGLPLRTTISEMGPLLLSRIMNLNPTQSDILTILFQIADEEELLLIDTKDLRSMLLYVSENAKEYSLKYGNMSKQSIAAITRAVTALEAVGGDQFFGEPALDIRDWICTDEQGKGRISILDCGELMQNPVMYATFLLWMMSELFEMLPEAGDCEKPKMIFFFDEAHMLFDDAPKALLAKIEQVVKLIRSKGVGIYFITQNPADIPGGVLSQLGNKIQHALHAYTPAEQKGAKAAAQSFRANPEFDTLEEMTRLGIGQALISVLDEEGIPTIVKKCRILPPQSRMGAVSEAEREAQIRGNLLYSRYQEAIDRDSAYEFLQRKAISDAEEAERKKEEEARQKQLEKEEAARQKQLEKEEAARLKQLEKKDAAQQKRVNSAINQVGRSAAGTIGRELGNTVGKTLGGSFGKRLGGNMGASLGRGLFNTLFKK